MNEIQVSLFASAVRPLLWKSIIDSLKTTTVNVEIIFSGNIEPLELFENINLHKEAVLKFKWIKTGNIKPAQCYEIARRECSGEVAVWTADDAEYPDDVLGKAYRYWKEKNNKKLILSLQTKESGYGVSHSQLFDMNVHRFFGGNRRTPLMAPFCLISREFLNSLGGIDKRYLCGQYENDIIMRAYNEGATVEIFGDKRSFIDVDHLRKSIIIGESRNQEDFIKRPFATGYETDRKILEGSWAKNGCLEFTNNKWVRYDNFQPFENEEILTKSQSNKGKWI